MRTITIYRSEVETLAFGKEDFNQWHLYCKVLLENGIHFKAVFEDGDLSVSCAFGA